MHSIASNTYFNSIKVQLEPKDSASSIGQIFHFNSIKVQLERKTGHHPHHYDVFQFHKGTIRTLSAEQLEALYTISIP